MEKLIIFDLDDTLVDTASCYDKVLDEFYSRMTALFGTDRNEVRTVQEHLDSEIAVTATFVADRFPKSFSGTYEHFSAVRGVPREEETSRRFEELGWSVYSMIPRPKPGALELLESVKDRAELWLYTLGQESIQNPKIRENGLERYFERINIVPAKSAEVLAGLLDRPAASTAVVGDSLRFEINAAAEIGMFPVHLRNKGAWIHSKEPPRSERIRPVDDLFEARVILEDEFLGDGIE